MVCISTIINGIACYIQCCCIITKKGDFLLLANMGTKQVVLSTIWGGGVIYFLGDLTYKVLGNGVMAESFGRTKEILGF